MAAIPDNGHDRLPSDALIAAANAEASEAANEHSQELIEEFARAVARAPTPDRAVPKAKAIVIKQPVAPTDFGWEGRPWAPHMLATPKGYPLPLLANAISALSLDPEWADVLAHDVFAQSTCATAKPPIDAPIGAWSDVHDIRTTEWLQRVGIKVGVQVAAQAIEAVARNRQYHPVKLYLEDCYEKWDRTDRTAMWLVDYCECEDSAYARSIAQIFMVGAVARIYSPGCKLDTALILEGAQGKGKSSVFERLFSPWFTDDMGELGSKDSSMQVAGVWCIELAELSQMSRAEIEPVKAFITRRIDRYRPPYGHRVIERPRQSVFGGTVNSADYLKDEENRRFLPIRIGNSLNLDAIGTVRDQLWGEALHLYRNGVKWWMTDLGMLDEAREQQALRRQGDEWEESIGQWLHARVSQTEEFTLGEVLDKALNIRAERWDQPTQNRAARALRSLGWERFQRNRGGERAWMYRRRKIAQMGLLDPPIGAPETATATQR